MFQMRYIFGFGLLLIATITFGQQPYNTSYNYGNAFQRFSAWYALQIPNQDTLNYCSNTDSCTRNGSMTVRPQDGVLYYYSGGHWHGTTGGGGGGGTVTSVATSTGLIGGTITTSGTLQIDSSIVPKWDDTLSGNRWLVTPTYLASKGYGTGTVTTVSATGGNGISVSGSPITTAGTFTVTNTAPDQTVTIASGTGISVVSAYPAFTINATGTYVNSVTATTPITVSASTGTVNIGMPAATSSVNGYLSATNFGKFDASTQIVTFTGMYGTVLLNGSAKYFQVSSAQTITGWYVTSDVSGSVTVDILDNGADMIVGGNAPVLSSATTNNATVSGWSSVALATGHKYTVNIAGVSTISNLQIIFTTTIN